jgi:signal transduction histidine kinase
MLLLLAAGLLALSLVLGAQERASARADIDHRLVTRVSEETTLLDNYFERARSIALLTSRNPAFADFYATPGARLDKIDAGVPAIRDANDALAYLQRLFPTSIGEACFIDVSGPENARVVRGVYATPPHLSPDESQNPFFAPTFALDDGEVYQAQPYVSPDTGEWVISNSTIVPTGPGSSRAIVHFEVTVESFRQAAASLGEGGAIEVVDGATGRVVIDSRHEQVLGSPLGEGSLPWVTELGGTSGMLDAGGLRAAYRRLAPTPGNANDWVVVASASAISFLGGVGTVPIVLTVTALVLLGLGAVSSRRIARTIDAQHRQLREQGERLERAQEDRGRLLQRVVEAAEDERRLIAAELHDGPIQDLTSLDYRLEPIRLDLEDEGLPAEASVRETQERLREEIRNLRELVVGLRPPALDERGLEAALADHVRHVGRETSLECRMESALPGRLDPTLETVLYRVAQEALSNVVKHSRATRADVALSTRNGSVVLEVSDDGVGFDPARQADLVREGHLGLASMRERVELAGGSWRIESSPGEGTRVCAEVPR